MTDAASNGSFLENELDKTVEFPISPIQASCQSPASFDIPKDGSCFFKSLEYILGSQVWTSFSLRFLVARSVLEKDPIVDTYVTSTMIDLWKSQSQVDGNNVETSLMEQVISPDGSLNRYQLFENMLDRHRYWGDQYAIIVIESILLFRVLVVVPSETQPVAASSAHDAQWYIDRDINLFVVVQLHHEHYEPMCHEMLHRHELPDIVQELWKDDPHIFSSIC